MKIHVVIYRSTKTGLPKMCVIWTDASTQTYTVSVKDVNLSIDQVAEDIIARNTCGFTGCFNPPNFQLQVVHIKTTDDGEVELAGFKDDPLNRVCNEHKEDPATALLIANKAWQIVLRSIETENPEWLAAIGAKFRMTHFDLGWRELD